MPPKLIADTANAFEDALRDRGMSRADLTAARARTSELLTRAFDAVRTLDVIINNQPADDGIVQAVWKQARRMKRSPLAHDSHRTGGAVGRGGCLGDR